MNRFAKIEHIKKLLRPSPSMQMLVFTKDLNNEGFFRESPGPLDDNCNDRIYTRAELDKIKEQGNVIVVEIITSEYPIGETES